MPYVGFTLTVPNPNREGSPCPSRVDAVSLEGRHPEPRRGARAIVLMTARIGTTTDAQREVLAADGRPTDEVRTILLARPVRHPSPGVSSSRRTEPLPELATEGALHTLDVEHAAAVVVALELPLLQLSNGVPLGSVVLLGRTLPAVEPTDRAPQPLMTFAAERPVAEVRHLRDEMRHDPAIALSSHTASR